MSCCHTFVDLVYITVVLFVVVLAVDSGIIIYPIDNFEIC